MSKSMTKMDSTKKRAKNKKCSSKLIRPGPIKTYRRHCLYVHMLAFNSKFEKWLNTLNKIVKFTNLFCTHGWNLNDSGIRA